MERVRGLNQIVEVLRNQASDKSSRARKQASNERAAQPGKFDVAQLERHISERIKSIDADDPDRDLRAGQVFIGSVLGWEFGDELIQDNGFAEMIQEIHNMIESDPKLSKTFRHLIGQLIR